VVNHLPPDEVVRMLGHMDRSATDDRAAACAGAQFRQGHPHRHDVSLSLLAGSPCARFRFNNGLSVAYA
jgi:hypothetical protein